MKDVSLEYEKALERFKNQIKKCEFSSLIERFLNEHTSIPDPSDFSEPEYGYEEFKEFYKEAVSMLEDLEDDIEKIIDALKDLKDVVEDLV